MLHFIDDVTARAKCLVAMPRAHPHPDCELTDREAAEPVHAPSVLDAIPCRGFRDDAFSLPNRERLEGFVLESSHARAFVVIAHPALESREAATRRIPERRVQWPRIDRRMGEA